MLFCKSLNQGELPLDWKDAVVPYLFEYKSHFFVPENQSKNGGVTYTRGYAE